MRKHNVLLRFFFWITGGRPMKRLDSAFHDRVNGRLVSYYTDSYGRIWMAHGPWSFFRVEAARTYRNHRTLFGEGGAG